MQLSQVSYLRKLGALAVVISLTLVVASCGDDPAAPVPPINSAPGAPGIDTTAGAPADEAVSVPTATTLHWTCTDPDGDSLNYTVHLGTDAAPVAVSNDQTASSFTPASLSDNTLYYWQIVAKDPDGETTASPVWSFTTEGVIPGVETISTPNTPAGPVTGEVGESLAFSVTGSTSSEGHAVEYQINWGGVVSTSFISGSNANYTWDMAGTYEVTAIARCATHPDIISTTSSALTVTITEPVVETISTPNSLDGPTTGAVDVSLYYLLSGAESSLGHDVEYQVDWGDSGASLWSSAATRYHYWSIPGTYEVVVQARCADHPDVESAWSAAITVVISIPAEQINTPGIGTAAPTGGVGDLLEYAAYSGNSNLGHATELQFDWGDGTYSDWGPKDGLHYIRSHAWAAAGTYQISVQARCIEHPESVSEWSTPYSVEILATESVSTPILSTEGERTYTVGTYLGGIRGMLSVSSMGHDVQYQFDVNGTLSEWVDNYLYTLPTDVPIDYYIKAHARCAVHTDVVSDWSETTLIHIVE